MGLPEGVQGRDCRIWKRRYGYARFYKNLQLSINNDSNAAFADKLEATILDAHVSLLDPRQLYNVRAGEPRRSLRYRLSVERPSIVGECI